MTTDTCEAQHMISYMHMCEINAPFCSFSKLSHLTVRHHRAERVQVKFCQTSYNEKFSKILEEFGKLRELRAGFSDGNLVCKVIS